MIYALSDVVCIQEAASNCASHYLIACILPDMDENGKFARSS
jgi:hypothetical protein